MTYAHDSVEACSMNESKHAATPWRIGYARYASIEIVQDNMSKHQGEPVCLVLTPLVDGDGNQDIARRDANCRLIVASVNAVGMAAAELRMNPLAFAEELQSRVGGVLSSSLPFSAAAVCAAQNRLRRRYRMVCIALALALAANAMMLASRYAPST